MRVVFSSDEIYDLSKLYTYTQLAGLSSSEREEHYHGKDYVQNVLEEVLLGLGWKSSSYVGCEDRLANEAFAVRDPSETEYKISFQIDTYDSGKKAHLEVSIESENRDEYDIHLEQLKIAIKDRLIQDWKQCTWLLDEQSAELCTEAYKKANIVENELRAFISKVLIHFLGVNWICCFGLEKYAESVKELEKKFVQRVPEFDNINTVFLSMTLDTLASVMLKGSTYEEPVRLTRNDFRLLMEKGDKINVHDFLEKRKTPETSIWEDLFAQFIDDEDTFKSALTSFISGRNHIAHSKVLSKSAYDIIMHDFSNMEHKIISFYVDRKCR